MLMVPTYRENRDDDLLEQRLCRPFRWSPSREETAGIRLEWERFRDVIAAGHIYERPAQSQTSYIHVRPHGRNATDTVPTPGGRITVKVSFWLNQRFVQELVRSHHADWKGF
jgi:DNA mismatch repair protein MutH